MADVLQFSDTTRGVSIRESLEGIYWVVSEQDTPLLSTLPHIQARSLIEDWLAEDIASPTEVVAQAEVEIKESANRVSQRLRNVCMKNTEKVIVSTDARLEFEAATQDKYSEILGFRAIEMLKQIDHNLHFSQYAAGSQGIAGEERMTEGVLGWLIKTGVSPSAAATIAGISVAANYSSTWHKSGVSAASMTEAMFYDVQQASYEKGNDIGDNVVFVGASLKRRISSFATVHPVASTTSQPLSAWNMDAQSKMRHITVDVIEGEFGPLRIALDRRLNSGVSDVTYLGADAGGSTTTQNVVVAGARTWFALNPDFWSIFIFDNLNHKPLGRTIDGDAGFIRMVYGLKCHNPKAGFGMNLAA
jgi:hypothetical protein